MDETREPIYRAAERVSKARGTGELRRWMLWTLVAVGGLVTYAYLLTPRFW